MVEQIFLSLQVRQSVIISNKHGICTFPHEMSSDLKDSGKSQKFTDILPRAQSSSRNENFVSTSKNLLKNRYCTLPAVRYFT